MLAELRRYFAGAGVLEVETPLACSSSGTDPALQPVMARYTGPVFPQGTDLYLQTSPELGMNIEEWGKERTRKQIGRASCRERV